MKCPNCGMKINTGGRKSFNMPFTMVYDALKEYRSIIPAANDLGVSPAYIYKICGERGIKPLHIITGEYKA